jgi:hypothetical protein
MLAHMRTTIEINDELLARAKERARKEGTTLRALFEAILQAALSPTARSPRRFHLRDASFRGTGFARGVDPADWERMRRAAYEGRGG